MAEPSTATEMVRVPILGENGRISDYYIPEAIPQSVTAVTQAAQAAAQSANESIQSAAAAEKSASSASSSVEQAKTYATNASTYMTTAEGHADDAEESERGAQGYATAAAESAKQAAESAASIGTDVTDAQSAATAAKESAVQAAASASESAASATAADDASNDAETSAAAAKASETAASSSAEQAATSATSASASASAAAGSATDAASSATAAEKSKTDAQAILDEANAKFIESAAATTLAPGQAATAEVVDNVLNLGIPKGNKGDKGDTGTGVPDGGEPGQLLSKTDDGTAWVDPPSGNILVGTATGRVAHAEDAFAEKPREVRIEGRTVKNLWPVINGSYSGITVSTDDTGLITVSGTATNDVFIGVQTDGFVPGAHCMFDMSDVPSWASGSNRAYIEFYDSNKSTLAAYSLFDSYNESRGFDVPSGVARTVCRIAVMTGITVNDSFRIMLVEGSEAPDCFTPTGVHGVEPEKLVVAGKNLVNLDGAEYTKVPSSSSSSATFGDDGSVTITGATDQWNSCYVELKSVVLPPGSYVTSGFSNNNMLLLLTSKNVLNPLPSGDYYTNAGYPYRVNTNKGQSTTFKIDVPSRVAFSIGDQIAEGVSLTLYPQIELGSTATSYEPPNVTTTPLPEVELRSLPNGMCDELVIGADGTCQVERKTTEITFDGSEDEVYGWYPGGNKPYINLEKPSTVSSYIDSENKLFCDRLPVINGGWDSSIASVSISYIRPAQLYVGPIDGVTSENYTTEFRSWLQANPLTVVYGISDEAEPQSPVTLPVLPAPTFNVYPTGGYVPGDTSVGYERDINITINNMQEVIDGLVGGGQ